MSLFSGSLDEKQHQHKEEPSNIRRWERQVLKSGLRRILVKVTKVLQATS